ncbi:MAG TPA: hypothetical protein VM389_00360, partial [Phycisphaerae bacterium]|nr:hypothetical protein [Phycisphaerae bacterium]
MALLYKEDWAETKQRMIAWWAGENFGRCGLAVTAPRKGRAPAPTPPDTPEKMWYDLDYWSARNEWEHGRTFYGGEAIP